MATLLLATMDVAGIVFCHAGHRLNRDVVRSVQADGAVLFRRFLGFLKSDDH